MAPITPHICEELNSQVFKSGTSIHLDCWPKALEADEGAINEMVQFNRIIADIRQQKARNKLPQNAGLEKVRLSLPEKLSEELVAELKEISKVKEVEMIQGEFSVSA